MTISDADLAALIFSFKGMSDTQVGRDTHAALEELAELRANHRWLLEHRNRYQRIVNRRSSQRRSKA
mgnify:CR=1 FL=1